MGTAGQTWNSLGKIERDIRVLCDRGDFEKIDYVQGTNAIPIILHIRDYDIPAGCTARVYVKRPDGTVEYDNAEISGNDVEVNVKNSMFSVAGNSVLQIKITKESSVLVTFGLTVCVKQNYIDDSFKSENGTDIFDSMTEEMKAYMEDAKEDSANSAAASGNFSKLSESWAHGDTGVRDGENTNNSEFFAQLAQNLTDEAQKLLDQARKIVAAATSGALIPAGTVAFADLPVNPVVGYMYNISDDFTTDSRFEEGPGVGYKAGTNVYWTANGKWDAMAGSQVIGVKGDAEDEYRVGLVNITPEGIGLPDNVQEQLNSKIDSSRIVKSTNITEEGFLMDGKYLSERLNKINKFSDYEAASKPCLPFTNILAISPEEKNSANQKKYAIYQNPTIGILDDMPLPLRNVESFIYRDISYYDTNHVLVTLTEAHPVPGRVWINFYNTGNWEGWRCIQSQKGYDYPSTVSNFGNIGNDSVVSIYGTVSLQKLSDNKANLFITAKVDGNTATAGTDDENVKAFDLNKILSLVGISGINFNNKNTVVHIKNPEGISSISEGYGFRCNVGNVNGEKMLYIGRVYTNQGMFGGWGVTTEIYKVGSVFHVSIYNATYE